MSTPRSTKAARSAIVPSLAICDASVAVRWLVADPLSDAALDARDRYDLAAPWLVLSETANALRTQVAAGLMPAEMARRHMIGLPRQIELHGEDRVMPLALRLAINADHPVYDCVYAAMAMTLAAPLITGDARFARKFANVSDLEILTLQNWT
jgi:predicted nucleic acid-binding protein